MKRSDNLSEGLVYGTMVIMDRTYLMLKCLRRLFVML